LPAGVASARVTLCRDRALTASCVSFDATGSTGSPAADLAPGAWFWGLRGVRAGVAGGASSPVWRLRVASSTIAGARPWGGDPDVDGDGHADVLSAVSDVSLSVFAGGAMGPSAAPVTRAAPLESTGFGRSVDAAGDVNADGYGDVVVGAPGSNGVYLYLGSAAGLAATPSLTTGPVGSALGASVAGAGDVNGDGFDDVAAVSATGNAVWFIPGGASGLGMPVRVVLPTTATSVVAGAGDVDGDGYADVLLAGTPSAAGQLLRGGSTGLDAARAVTVDRASGPAGDVNGDGRGDLAFVSAGVARVVLGAATLAPTGVPIAGALADRVGVAQRGGDFNGDGFDDVLIGMTGNILGPSAFIAPGGSAGSGVAVPLASGFGSATLTGPIGAGDVDGDGRDELLTHRGGASELYVTRGSATGPDFGLLSSARLGGTPDLRHCAAAGDVDHDGHADLMCGGAIYRGAATGLGSTPAWVLTTDPVIEAGGIGDVNHDGFYDVGVLRTSIDEGVVSVSLGSATGPGALVAATRGLVSIFKTDASRRFVGAGDVNHDGVDDLVVGATVYFGRTPFAAPFSPASTDIALNVGAAGDINHDGFADVVTSRRTPGGTPTESQVRAGSTAGLGATLATLPAHSSLPVALGDVNGDLFADLAVPAPDGIRIHLGSSTGLTALPAATFPGFGVWGVGDVDHDGRPDFVVSGSFGADLHFGGPGYATAPALRWPDHTSDTAVRTRGAAGFGDVDGDGTDDLLLSMTQGVAVQRVAPAAARPVVLASPSASGALVYR